MAAVEVDTVKLDQPVKLEAPSSPIRKRRRRVPTTGASEDCFACQKRQTKCDRRRPYCSQCLDIGKECSGYRTTLTWGVGVASRGKLRGMTLPIAKSNQPPPTSAPARKQSASSTGSSNLETQARDQDGQAPRKRARLTPLNTNAAGMHHSTPPLTSTGYNPAGAVPYPPQNGWQVPSFHAHRQGFNQKAQPPRLFFPDRRGDLFPLRTAIGNSFPDHSPWSTPTVMSNESEYSAEDFMNSPVDPITGYVHPTSNSTPIDQYMPMSATAWNFPVSYDSLNSSQAPVTPLHSMHAHSQAPPIDHVNSDRPTFPIQDVVQDPMMVNDGRKRSISDPTMTLWSMRDPHVDGSGLNLKASNSENGVASKHSENYTLSPRLAYDLSGTQIPPRIQYLIDYYDKAICPVLVAFDGPKNPYRMHIIHLALENPGLQNALAALATNNMRMKCLQDIPRMDNDAEWSKGQISAAIGVPSPEEQHYKAMSIEILNSQLASHAQAKDDAVLATLLILCLFHVCDSGFSKFKTQLAGVQKLLRMRGNPKDSDFVDWVEMFFAWFDVMTAAVNDRETQVRDETLDLTDLSRNLGALEQFSGCEGRLFKLISRLGRLNLLSQNRQVSKSPTWTTNGQSKRPELQRSASSKDFYSLPEEQFDESCWEGLMPPSLNNYQPSEAADGRHEFWQEWRDLRERLQAWKLDASSSESHPHLLHMSESFRYSALLYTERLAFPQWPSSSQNLQDLVSKALHHITEIGTGSCVTKFMLWPLFITGTECVLDSQRDLIRDRCIEIQRESGFYNNVSGLEVLERIWREGEKGREMGKTSCGVQAFHWRNAMDRIDGEYIVI